MHIQKHLQGFTSIWRPDKKRTNDIRWLIGKLGNQKTLERFEEAYNGYYSYKGGVKDKKAATLSMRNFLVY